MIWSNIGVFAAALIAALVAAAFGAAQLGLAFVRVHTEIVIAAPPETVWAVITEFNDYPDWNPLMIEVAGEPRLGSRLDWSSQINGAVRQYNGKVVRADRPGELAWTGPVARFPRTLFWGHHRLILERTADGGTRFVNSERFGGLATILLARFLRRDVGAAYAVMNDAVRRRAEASSVR